MKKNKSRKKIRYYNYLPILGFVFLSCVFLYLWGLNRRTDTYTDPAAPLTPFSYVNKKPLEVYLSNSFRKFFSSGELKKLVDHILAEESGDYAVIIKNLKTGESYSFSEHELFNSASLYKLWVMSAVYERVELGLLNENDLLAKTPQQLSKSFRLPSETVYYSGRPLTIDSAIKNMITVSDNYSAYLLTDRLGLANFKDYVNRHGFYESTLGGDSNTPVVTAYDTALFFEKLYSGELADPAYTFKMLEILKEQERNHKLPLYLEDSVEIAHKTGELDQVSHDAGIVYTNKGNYIIVVLSRTESPSRANDVIGRLSKAVYTYFQS